MRYEIRNGKFGAFFYDLDLQCSMTLEDVLKQLENVKKCDVCGENAFQVYCVECLKNSVYETYRLFASYLAKPINIEKVREIMRDFEIQFYDIISIIAKDEWDSDTSSALRNRRDIIRRIFKKLETKN